MELKDKLKNIGFEYKDGEVDLFYITINDYTIEVDLKSKKIDYGKKIKVNNIDALNADKPENVVRLECITRLLKKGYLPEVIELERKYKLGHKFKGAADIIVSKDKKTYMLIECKRDEEELEKEKNQMLEDGGQLFSYYQQDKNAKVLMLYTCNFNNLDNSRNLIILTGEDFKNTYTLSEIYARWNKQFATTGVFEDGVLPYSIVVKPLKHSDLEDLNERDSKIIFNQFQEILRHNVISDKPNAFNKMINLLLCKLVDEFEDNKEYLEFQWIEGRDTEETFMTRLNDLYKRGMDKYFGKKLMDYTEKDIFEASNNNPKLIEMFNNLRLKKNNEFAFKEVFDNRTFIENTAIVREMVNLIQGKKFKYSYKQQFLGEFFELLLNTSLKQEAGQFFTPIPIVRFILKSIPILEIINKKAKDGEVNFLPYLIDYAVGTGHFLTEAMDLYEHIIRDGYIDTKDLNSQQRDEVDIWSKTNVQYQWANEYIYGIEKDYRLVKSAKVSCILNGDGSKGDGAVIINGDGLDNFRTSQDYKGKLKKYDLSDSKLNEQFDILVANPPYSVNAFRNYLHDAQNSFELYSKLTENSSEIECLFIERAYQLLKPGGVAGIILPSSVLSNGKIYASARNIIFKYFDVISIVSLGDRTFMETGTNTIILFLRKRDRASFERIKIVVEKALNSSEQLRDITINGIDHCISKYLKDVYNEEMTIEEYDTLLKDCKELNNSIAEGYKKCSRKEIREYEIDKLLTYALSYNQKVIIANTGDSKDNQVNFLGYSFSKRRKYEGMHKRLDDDGNLVSKLYSETNTLDETKLNYCIYNNFLGNDFEIDSSLEENVNKYNLKDLIEFDAIGPEYIAKISTRPIDKFRVKSQYDVKKLGTLLKQEPISGSTPFKENKEYWDSNDVPWVTLEDFSEDLYLNNSIKYVSKKAVEDKKVRIVPENSVLMSCTATLGKVAINTFECTTNQQINALICDESQILPEFLAYYLSSNDSHLYYLTNNLGVKHINLTMLKNLQIIVPPLEVQRKILESIRGEKEKLFDIQEKIKAGREDIVKEISKYMSEKYELLEDICVDGGVKIGGTPASYEYKYYHNGNNLWVKIADMQGKVITDTAKKINDLGVKNSNVKLIKKGSTLVSFKLSIGRTAIAGRDLYTNEAIMGLEPKKEIDNKYLFYVFKYNLVDMTADQKAFGKSLNLPLLKKLKVPYIYDDAVKERLIRDMDAREEALDVLRNQEIEISRKMQEDFDGCLRKE